MSDVNYAADYYKEKLSEIQESNQIAFINTENVPDIYFMVDWNTRRIITPPDYTFFATKNEHNADTVYFLADRYYKGVDLTTKTCVVQFITSEKNEGIYTVPEIKITDNDKIIVPWVIENDSTKEAGVIGFALRFYSIDIEENEFTYNLVSLTAKSLVLDTLDVNNHFSEKYQPSELQIWLERMSNTRNEMISEIQNKADQSLNEIENKKQSAIEGVTDQQETAILVIMDEKEISLENIDIATNDALSEINNTKTTSINDIDKKTQKVIQEISSISDSAIEEVEKVIEENDIYTKSEVDHKFSLFETNDIKYWTDERVDMKKMEPGIYHFPANTEIAYLRTDGAETSMKPSTESYFVITGNDSNVHFIGFCGQPKNNNELIYVGGASRNSYGGVHKEILGTYISTVGSNETFTGIKTFTATPKLTGEITDAEHMVNKEYVDSRTQTLTSEEYEALTDEEKEGKIFYIKDGTDSGGVTPDYTLSLDNIIIQYGQGIITYNDNGSVTIVGQNNGSLEQGFIIPFETYIEAGSSVNITIYGSVDGDADGLRMWLSNDSMASLSSELEPIKFETEYKMTNIGSVLSTAIMLKKRNGKTVNSITITKVVAISE